MSKKPRCPRCKCKKLTTKMISNQLETVCTKCGHYDDEQFFRAPLKEFTKETLSIKKPIFDAIEPKFTLGMADVLAFGADKYSRDNWMSCPQDQLHLYWDALHRHLNAYRLGEENDQETGLSHLHHAACNMMFIDKLTKIKGDEDEV